MKISDKNTQQAAEKKDITAAEQKEVNQQLSSDDSPSYDVKTKIPPQLLFFKTFLSLLKTEPLSLQTYQTSIYS